MFYGKKVVVVVEGSWMLRLSGNKGQQYEQAFKRPRAHLKRKGSLDIFQQNFQKNAAYSPKKGTSGE